MIEESYVGFETAKLLKGRGFNEPTRFVWYERLPASIGCDNSKIGKNCMELFYWNSTTQFEQPFINNREIPNYIQGEVYSAPTQQMAMRWLREEKEIDIKIRPVWIYDKKYYCWTISKGIEDKVMSWENTYEEAVEAAIKYCLRELI